MTAETRKQRLPRLEFLFVSLAHLLRHRLHKRSAKISCDGGRQQNFSALWARTSCAWRMDRRVCDYAWSIAPIRHNWWRKNHTCSADEIFEEYDFEGSAFDWSCPPLAEDIFKPLALEWSVIAQKWSDVRDNPVWAGLVKKAEDWPFMGEIFALEYRFG